MTLRSDLAAGIDALPSQAAIPRANGEMVFSQPWQARAFALAVALCETGRYPWNEFRSRLIEEVGAGDGEEGTDYYQCWLAALERLVEETGLASPSEVAEMVRLIEREDAHDDHDGHEHHHH